MRLAGGNIRPSGTSMTATRDEPKRLAKLAQHGLDFADFDSGFDGETASIRSTHPSRTGRAQYKLIGDCNGERVVAVVVSPLGRRVLSLVSLLPASPKERTVYARYIAGPGSA